MDVRVAVASAISSGAAALVLVLTTLVVVFLKRWRSRRAFFVRGAQREHTPFRLRGAARCGGAWPPSPRGLVWRGNRVATQFRFDAIVGLPSGQVWLLRYRGPEWRVAGQGGMERMTGQIATGRVQLEVLQQLCRDIPGLSVHVRSEATTAPQTGDLPSSG
jgi:hypothetical protein